MSKYLKIKKKKKLEQSKEGKGSEKVNTPATLVVLKSNFIVRPTCFIIKATSRNVFVH